MKKIIKEVDTKRGIMQVTVSDERWYMKPSKDPVTGNPTYLAVPSVTWIAGQYPKGIAFYKWLADKGWDESQALKQAAGDKGSMVHLAVEHILNGYEMRIDTKFLDKSSGLMRELTHEELVCVKSFVDWRKEWEEEYEVETLASEIVIFSEKHNYAGTVDWIVRLTNKETKEVETVIVDFKTSKQIWTEYELQVSAYRRAIESGENPVYEKNENGTESNKTIDVTNLKMAILQLGYDKNKAGYKWTPIEDAFDMFLTAQKIWQRECGNQQPKGLDFPVVLAEGKKMDEGFPMEGSVSPEAFVATPEQALEIEAEVLQAKPKKK